MKRARLVLTWDELLLVRSGLESERGFLTRQLEREAERPDRYPAIQEHYRDKLADLERLLPRVERAIERT